MHTMITMYLQVFGIIAMYVVSLVAGGEQIPKIARNNALVVPYGRSAWLDPQEHLFIEVPERCRCEVTVVRDDPLAERTGYLTPDEFSCRFSQGKVKYVHLGSKAPSEDFVKLSVRLDCPTSTFLRRIALEVNVNFVPMNIVQIKKDLIVSEPGRVSSAIDSQILEFTYDQQSTKDCRIVIRDSEKGLPRYGELLNATMALRKMINCTAFLAADVRYKHTREALSSNRDYIPLLVEVLLENGQREVENFQLAVRIMGARKNERPKASFQALELMSVDQHVTTLITTDVLDAEDKETNADYLIFNITKPLIPEKGYIVNTDDLYTPITSFYRKDLKELKIAYKPPSKMINFRQTLEILFEVIDEDALHSLPIRLLIEVRPRTTLAPIVTKNKELVLFEGQSRIISSQGNLEVIDKDNIEDVKVQVVGGLRHGELYVNGKAASTFTPADLDNGTILYQHDDSDTYSDNIILNVTDGEHHVEFVFVINIMSVDDQMPILVANTGLELIKGQHAIIDEHSLKAFDVDSDTSKIEFLVGSQLQRGAYWVEGMDEPGLQAGLLMLRQTETPKNPDLWWNRGSHWVRSNINSFTQEDIQKRRLYYVHSGTEIFEDRFYFQMTDNAEKPNQSSLKVFKIFIKQHDKKSPKLDTDSTLLLEVRNSNLVKLTRKMIWYTDEDSNDLDLFYTIEKAPHFLNSGENETADAGHIVSSDHPEKILSTFTQRMLRHHKVAYKPPSALYRHTDIYIKFHFTVYDPARNNVTKQKFYILLSADVSHTDRERVFTLYFDNNGKVLLPTKQNLKWQQFTIDALPASGALYKSGRRLDISDSFTIEDIENQRILFVPQKTNNDGSDQIRVRKFNGKKMATLHIQAGTLTLYKEINCKLLSN